MDAYAFESHRRAAAATDSGTSPGRFPYRSGTRGALTGARLSTDEGIRAGRPPGGAGRAGPGPDLRARHRPRHHRRELLADDRRGRGHAHRRALGGRTLGLPVRARLARFDAWRPTTPPSSAPVPATRKLLERTGMKVEDFDAVECNEAFAAIALMWAPPSAPTPSCFNPRGGAIAMAIRWGRRGPAHDHAPQPAERRPAAAAASDHVRGRRPGQRQRMAAPSRRPAAPADPADASRGRPGL